MIKISVVEKNFDYPNVGRQGYDLTTDIAVIEDAYASDVIDAIVTAMRIAGFHDKSIKEALIELADTLEVDEDGKN